VIVVLEREDLGAQPHSGAAVAASVAPLVVVLVCVRHSVAVVVLVVEDLDARLRSDEAPAASVAPLADALPEAPVAPAVVSCASVDCAQLEVAVAALLSALVDVLVFLLALPGLVPVVELWRQRAQRSAVEFELASAAAEFAFAAARAAAFAGEHLYCLELPRQRSWPFAACVLRPSLVQLDLTFELLPPVAHP
jgi:hypothetical protein